jgi:hypothetical protein
MPSFWPPPVWKHSCPAATVTKNEKSNILSRPTLVVGITHLVFALVRKVQAGIVEKMLEDRYTEYAEYRGRTNDTFRF